jgi:hypothetical protein
MPFYIVIWKRLFMRQAPAFEEPTQPDHLCKLKKALYGLKQTPRAWYSRLSTKLQKLGFITLKADTLLFIYRTKNTTVYILVYVNDIIIASSCREATAVLINQLRKEFAVKDLGELHYFLGIEVIRNNGELPI